MTVTEFLRTKVPFLGGLTAEQAHSLAAAAEQIPFRGGQTLLDQGAAVSGLHVVATGKVSLWVKPDPGQPALTILQLGPGEVFGKISVADALPSGEAAKAEEDDTLVFIIPEEAFRAVLEQNAELRARITSAARKPAAASPAPPKPAAKSPEAPRSAAAAPPPLRPAKSKLSQVLPLLLSLGVAGGLVARSFLATPPMHHAPPKPKGSETPRRASRRHAHANSGPKVPENGSAPAPAQETEGAEQDGSSPRQKHPAKSGAPDAAEEAPAETKTAPPAARAAAGAAEPATEPAVDASSSPSKAEQQNLFDMHQQLDAQLLSLRNKCANPGVAALARSARTLSLACEDAAARLQKVAAMLQDDGNNLEKTDPGLKAALSALQEQITQSRGATPDMIDALRQAQTVLLHASSCLDLLGGQAALPPATAAACHEEALTGFSGIGATLSAVQALRRDGHAVFSNLIRTVRSKSAGNSADNAWQYSFAGVLLDEAEDRYANGLTAVVKAISAEDFAMSQTRKRNSQTLWQATVYSLRQLQDLHDRAHSLELPALPARDEAIRDIDAATGRLELAESAWDKAGAASDRVSSGLAAAAASREAVASLNYLVHAEELLGSLMARFPESAPALQSPSNPPARRARRAKRLANPRPRKPKRSDPGKP